MVPSRRRNFVNAWKVILFYAENDVTIRITEHQMKDMLMFYILQFEVRKRFVKKLIRTLSKFLRRYIFLMIMTTIFCVYYVVITKI